MKPSCLSCAWLFEPGDYYVPEYSDNPWTCMAFFPSPIPEDILRGEFAHRVKHPLQIGELVYTPQNNYVKPE